MAAVAADPDSAFATQLGETIDGGLDTIRPDHGSRAVGKGELRVNVKDFGAVGDGVTDDTAAINKAKAAALASGAEFWVPHGTYLSDAPITWADVSDVRVHMDGRVKRKDTSSRDSLFLFRNVSGLQIGTIRTDGNVASNGLAQSDAVVYPVDEAKHDVRLDGCADVDISLIDSRNPAGDTLYITGGTTRVKIDRVNAVADRSSGRNAVSLIDCSKVSLNALTSVGVGCSDGVVAMPGGFDIEPNRGQTVSDVTVGQIIVDTSGASGFSVFGNYTVEGVRQINRVSIGSVVLTKTAGVRSAACDIPVRGVERLNVASLLHTTDAANANQALSIVDASDVEINVDIPRSGGAVPVRIGASAIVDRLTLRGRIGKSGGHCIEVGALTNSRIDMSLKNPADGCMVISKNATGTSSNVRFNGDWAKATTGSGAMNIEGTVTGWLLDGVDLTGWAAGHRVRGSGNPGAVERRNVRGLTYGTAAPVGDAWDVGQFVDNLTPTEQGTAGAKFVIRGWVCVVAGDPGAWVPVRALTGN
ncbi:hypothetical protein SRABI121_02955 [Microbacterium sp. Bi121]|nr:hypothetical protein SRABI121_02955 [Microbacterium sp. Bi121]